MSLDLLWITEYLQAPRIVLNLVDRAIEVGSFTIGREDIRPHEVSNATLIQLEPYISMRWATYREHETNENQAKVEALLRGPSRLLPCGKLVPRYEPIVIEWSHGSASRTWRRSCPQAVLGGVVSWEEE